MTTVAFGQINTDELPTWGSRSADCFEKIKQIGAGMYGQVFKAREIRTGEIVALKRIRMDKEKEGFPITAIREIKLLKKLHHENIIKLKEIVTSAGPEKNDQENQDSKKLEGGIYMVFEYMDHDLTGLADRLGVRFSIPQIKCYIKQLLTGLHYCHINQVLHRDMKGSNLLLDNEGKLKLADFGLAKSFATNHEGQLTNCVITLWYRPPELLLGATKYGPAVDMWSVGCIFAELLNGSPILQGRTEPDQLNKIFELCGSPDENNWPGVSKYYYYNNFKPQRPLKRRVRERFRRFDSHALDLLDHLLTLDPSQRWSAKQALDAEYFWVDPLPCDPKSLPKYESSHEFETKKRKLEQRQLEEQNKRPRLQRGRLPPYQHTEPHQMKDMQPSFSAGPSHYPYGKHPAPPGGPSMYPPRNQSGAYNPSRGGHVGGYSGEPYPPQGRAPQYNGSSMPASGPSGPPGGYGVGPPNYSQTSQYGGPAPGRGPNIGVSSMAGSNSKLVMLRISKLC